MRTRRISHFCLLRIRRIRLRLAPITPDGGGAVALTADAAEACADHTRWRKRRIRIHVHVRGLSKFELTSIVYIPFTGCALSFHCIYEVLPNNYYFLIYGAFVCLDAWGRPLCLTSSTNSSCRYFFASSAKTSLASLIVACVLPSKMFACALFRLTTRDVTPSPFVASEYSTIKKRVSSL